MILSSALLPCEDTPEIKVIRCIQQVVASLLQPGATGAFISLDTVLGIFPTHFNGATQECASEFLHYLLNIWDHDFAKYFEFRPLEIMIGEIKNTLTFPCCGGVREECVECGIVPLCIPSKDGTFLDHCSVQQMIDNLYLPETFQLKDPCASCSTHSAAQKDMMFSTVSPVFIVSIQIFQNLGGGSTRKILSKIDVDETVSIRHCCGIVKKKLTSVIYHVGKTRTSGHYLMRYIAPDGRWYEANDELVKVVDGPHRSGNSVMPYLAIYSMMEGLPDPIHGALSTLASGFEFLPLIKEDTRWSPI
jgi:uncharacterized UBP type Zn finger protein